MTAETGPVKHRRIYRACLPCRQRRLKCDQGDPDHPTAPECARCRRERRTCYFEDASSPSTGKVKGKRTLDPRSTPPPPMTERTASSLQSVRVPTSSYIGGDIASPHISLRTAVDNLQPALPHPESWNIRERQRLISSSLHTPSDALDILAASAEGQKPAGPTGRIHRDPVLAAADGDVWSSWEPVALGLLSVTEARKNLTAFQQQLHPLYPILHTSVFSQPTISALMVDSPLLLGVMIALGSSFGNPQGDCHKPMSQWIAGKLNTFLQGSLTMRTVATVEAILLWAEWPAESTLGVDDNEPDRALDLHGEMMQIKQADARSWTYIGLAVRLAQEMDLQAQCLVHATMGGRSSVPLHWHQERDIRTWLFCYNADRQISMRLGKSAVIQPYLSSQWWEALSLLATRSASRQWNRPMGYELGRQHGLIAALIGTVHDRFFSEGDVTSSLLRTGQWENLLRNLSMEIAQFHKDIAVLLESSDPQVVLLDLELHYIRLYGNGIALRALQERLTRIQQSGTQGYNGRSLFNLAEGPFILAAIEAARDILRISCRSLHASQKLAQCPTRVFHRLIYAATFLLKVMAMGVIEDSGKSIRPLLEETKQAMEQAAKLHHVAKGMSMLLSNMLMVHVNISCEQMQYHSWDTTRGEDSEPLSSQPTTINPPLSPHSTVAPNLSLPTAEGLAVHDQQDQAFRELFGDEIFGDTQLAALFASCVNDDFNSIRQSHT